MNKLTDADISNLISGQVILDMKNAVKELVENSLDANAQSINVLFKNHGLDGIVVTDDGVGIAKEDFESLCALHATAKIDNFDDIQNINGFGFRGQALASLAVLGKLKVHTATEYDDVGHYLTFDFGNLKSVIPKARRIGTTIELYDLFWNLPVRGKELQRNISKEYAKTVDLLYSYAIMAIGVKMVVSRDSTIVFQTLGTRNQLETINSLLGSKFTKSLVPFSSSMDEVGKSQVTISGFLSKPLGNCAKSSSERQYFYINNRPCDLPVLARCINSVFHEFVPGKYPAIILYLVLETGNFDVNLAPDKRTILINQEDVLFSWIKQKVYELYEPFRQSLHIYGGDSTDLVSSFTFSSQSDQTASVYENDSLPNFSCPLIEDVDTISTLDEALNSDGVSSEKISKVNESSSLSQTPKTPLTQSSLRSLFEFQGIKPVKKETPTFSQPKKKQKKLSFLNVEPSSKKVKRNSIYPIIQGDTKISVTIEDIISQTDVKSGYHKEANHFEAHLSDSVNAEKELTRFVTKDDFKQMKVLGQFNLGFIIVLLKNDLFVIDQHASDEKYTFETLMKTIHTFGQNLVNPLPIKFSSSLENTALSHLSQIRKYGFDLQVKEDNVRSLFLIRVPVLKNLTLGAQDLEELLLKLESGDMNPLPSRVRGWYASKACRTSVMIGTALTFNKMRRIVFNLSGLDHPWNCPHGRPTMRHLYFLER